MRWLIMLTLATAVPPASTFPGFVDAAKLASVCSGAGNSSTAFAAQAVCLGYVMGSLDQVMAGQARREPDRRTICLPAGLTAEDVRAAVARHAVYAERAKGIGAAGFVRYALEIDYPCHPAAPR